MIVYLLDVDLPDLFSDQMKITMGFPLDRRMTLGIFLVS